jgi:hypothetical protein
LNSAERLSGLQISFQSTEYFLAVPVPTVHFLAVPGPAVPEWILLPGQTFFQVPVWLLSLLASTGHSEYFAPVQAW